MHSPAALQRVLADDDLAALCLVPGVGKKTAARLLVELKARLDMPGVELAAIAGNDEPVDRPARRRLVPTSATRSPTSVTAQTKSPTPLRELPDQGDPAELLKVALQRLAVG